MYGSNAFGVPPHAEGVPVSGVWYNNRASSVVAGSEAGLRAGSGGVAIGRFGWAEPDGTVLNERVSDQGVIGLVVIEGGDWRRVFWDDATRIWRIRQGLNLTMLSAAPGMLVHLPDEPQWNAPIYTSPLDGVPVAAYAVGLELTKWVVGQPRTPGGLSLITTWNTAT